MFRFAVVLALVFSLSACGFKLRGDIDIPNYLQTIYITPNDPYESFQRELRERLTKYKIKVVNRPQTNIPSLELSRPEINELVLAIGSSGQGQRLKLIMKLEYKFMGEHRTITRSRELSISNNLLLSNEGEKQIVQKELLSETVNELLRQLSSRPRTNDNNP